MRCHRRCGPKVWLLSSTPSASKSQGLRALVSVNRVLLSSSRCVKDETYESYTQPAPHIVRFKFSSFHFLNRFPSVYLQCKMVVCRANDYSSRCHRGCMVRSKRGVSSYQEKVDVVLGPILLRPLHAEKRSLGRWPPSQPTAHRGPVP